MVTDYVYDEDDVILIVETPQAAGAVSTVTRVVHGPDVDEPLWVDRAGQLSVLHADGLGSVRLAMDAAQAVVERTDDTAFGELARAGGAGQPFAFTGREWDGARGLSYHRRATYDPEGVASSAVIRSGPSPGRIRTRTSRTARPTTSQLPRRFWPGRRHVP